MSARRTIVAYGLLLTAVLLVLSWQGFEHVRVRKAAEAGLQRRARDISGSLAVVMRSQARFSIIVQEYLEAALYELTKSHDLAAVALLNAAGEVVGAAGDLPDFNLDTISEEGAHWTQGVFTVVIPVDFGQGTDDGASEAPAAVVTLDEEYMRAAHERFRSSDFAKRLRRQFEEGRPPGERGPRKGEPGPGEGEPPKDERSPDEATAPGAPPPDPGSRPRGDGKDRGRGRMGPPSPFGRPHWMTEEEFGGLLEKRGAHWVLLGLSGDAYRAECARDLRLRTGLAFITLVAALGLGVAWHYLDRFTRIQMRLVRASEMNIHLQEMNVAAAGLAHETRNPLNLIRGVAQVIAGHPSAADGIRENSGEIIEEVDRITARLNQFMDYSKPPEARPAPTDLKKVLHDVARTLEGELEDKQATLDILGEDFAVQADESLVRQVLFNLLLNAIQAIGQEGRITFELRRNAKGTACFEFRDDGPGVREEAADKIFRPYFTTGENGVGLGLAVVRQIVLAHQWDIEYVRGENGGSIFRVNGLNTS
jgi:signal transduction histidine kinase